MSLKSKEQKIYELLKVKATSQDKDGYFCVYPIKKLSKDCNINSRTVMRALQELEKSDYILRKRQDDHQTQKIYLLNVTCSTMSGEKNVTCSTMGVEENVTCSTMSEENVTSTNCDDVFAEKNVTSTMCGGNVPSTICGENVPSTMRGENVTCSTMSVEENVTCSTMSEENVTCSTMSVEENVTCSTMSEENVTSTNCVVITKSQKKPLLPHMELSAIQAERMFYVLPTGPVSNFLFDILNSGKDIAELPARKKQVNHSTHYEVKQNKEKRLVTMDNDSCTVSVEIKNIDELSKTGMRFFVLAMIKANEQIIHDGKLSREYITLCSISHKYPDIFSVYPTIPPNFFIIYATLQGKIHKVSLKKAISQSNSEPYKTL